MELFTKKPKDTLSPALLLDPYRNRKYLFEKNKITRPGKLKSIQKVFKLSYVQTKDVIIETVTISVNIPQEDLRSVIELKIFEELDLDPTIEYTIDFLEIPSSHPEKERKFLVFITENKILEETYQKFIKEFRHINHIVPLPLLFRTLYTHNILDSQEIHVFIYFHKSDAVLALYMKGYLIYAKALRYSFMEIAERLSELTGQNVSVDSVEETIYKYGLKLNDLDLLQHYMQVFSEIFMHINDILIYIKRAYKIDIIDKLFISSYMGPIKGIEEYAQTYLAQESYDFTLFDYGVESEEDILDDFIYLLALTALDIQQKYIVYPNLSIYRPPLPLLKRPSGKLLLISAASVVTALAFPIYQLLLGYKYQFDAHLLEKRYQSIHQERIALEAQIKNLQNQIAQKEKQVQHERELLNKKMALLNRVYDKKVNYLMKGKTIADLSQKLVQFKIHALEIDNNATHFDLNVTANSDKYITSFVRHLSEKTSYYVVLDSIEKVDVNSTIYTSILRVDVQ